MADHEEEHLTPGEGIKVKPETKMTQTFIATCAMAYFGGSLIFGIQISTLGNPAGNIKSFMYDPDGSKNSAELELLPDGNPEKDAMNSDKNMLFAFLVSIFIIGSFIGSYMSGIFSDKFGRKRSILMFQSTTLTASVLFLLSTIVGGTFGVALLFLARLVIGIGVGVTICIVPCFVIEIAPRHLRGALGTASQLFVTIGICLAQISGTQALLGGPSTFNIHLALVGVPAVLSICLSFVAVESPKYLLCIANKETEARAALKLLTGLDNVDAQVAELKLEQASSKDEEVWGTLRLLRTGYLFKPLVVIVLLNAVQQLSGINVVFYFSGSMFLKAGITDQNVRDWAGVAIGVVNVGMTVVAVWAVERFGRRILLFGGMVVMVACMGILTVSTYIADSSAADPVDVSLTAANVTTLAPQSDGNPAAIVAIIATIIYVMGFAIGLGPIPLFIGSEVMREGPRATAMGIGGMANFSCNFLIAMLFEWVMQQHLKSFAYLPFVVCVCVIGGYLWVVCPETKNRDITAVYKDMNVIEPQGAAEMSRLKIDDDAAPIVKSQQSLSVVT